MFVDVMVPFIFISFAFAVFESMSTALTPERLALPAHATEADQTQLGAIDTGQNGVCRV